MITPPTLLAVSPHYLDRRGGCTVWSVDVDVIKLIEYWNVVDLAIIKSLSSKHAIGLFYELI
jgi:hypothetical protein